MSRDERKKAKGGSCHKNLTLSPDKNTDVDKSQIMLNYIF